MDHGLKVSPKASGCHAPPAWPLASACWAPLAPTPCAAASPLPTNMVILAWEKTRKRDILSI